MKKLKLTIEMLPKGAWNNDFSKTLPKKQWDILRNECYKRANHKCQICGYETDDLDAHEIWEFDIDNKIQKLVNIVGICSKCHGVKHMRNSQRLGYGEDAKKHFMNVNGCSELDYATHFAKAKMDFEERNKIYRWKIVADLEKFGLKDAALKTKNIPLIKSVYENVDFTMLSFENNKKLFKSYVSLPKKYWITPPKVLSIVIDNYQGKIEVVSDDVNRIEWYLDNQKIKTKYNVVGKFITTLSVENLKGTELTFILFGIGGKTVSKIFELSPQEVI